MENRLKESVLAQRVIHQLVDDLDGSDIAEGRGERIPFAVRGVSYVIDLSSANVAKFDKALKPFLAAASKEKARRPRKARSAVVSKAAVPQDRNAAIRAWAADNGYVVSPRGRIKAEIVEAFDAAR